MASTSINVVINGKGVVSGLDPVDLGLKRLEKQAKKTQAEITKSYKINFNASSFNAVNTSVSKSLANLNKLSPSFQKINTGVKAVGANTASAVSGLKNLETSFKGISSAVTTFSTVVTGGVVGAALVRGIGAAVDKSVELENALIGVSTVAKSFGQDQDAVKKAVIDFTKDGLISATEAALAFKQVLSTGTDLPTAIKLMNSLKDAAAFNRQSFYTLGEAVVATTEGIKNGNSVRADAVGITKNLSVLDKEYAASVGKTVESLSDMEKTQARVNGFIREASVFAGDAEKALDTYSGSVTKLGTSYDRMLASVGNFVTRSETVKATISGLTRFFNDMQESLDDESNERRIEKIKSQLNGFLKNSPESAYRKELEAELKLLENHVQLTQERNDRAAALKQKEIANKKQIEETTKAFAAATKKRADELKKLEQKYELGGGLSNTEKLKAQFDKEMSLAAGHFDLRFAIVKEYYKKLEELQDKDKNKQIKDANEMIKLQKTIGREALTKAAANPFATEAAPAGLTPEQQSQYNQNRRIGQGVGLLNNVANGADGAANLVSSIGAMGLDALVPGLGEAAKPLLDAFTKGPDAVKQMVKDFSKALPDIVQGFVEAIPVFIEELSNQLPVIVERLAEKAPEIISKLVEAAPRVTFALMSAMPKVALKFAGELIKNLPKIVSEAARAIYEAISKALGKLTGGLLGDSKGGGVTGKAKQALATGPTGNSSVNTGLNIVTLGASGTLTQGYNTVKRILGFANGGVAKAMGGAPFTDSINSKVQAGEMWVDHSLTGKMEKFFNGGQTQANDQLIGMMNKVIELLSQPQTVEAVAQVQDEAFAKIFLRLNRQNKRLGFS